MAAKIKKEGTEQEALVSSQRPYKLAHQTLAVTAIDFNSRTLVGYSELVIYPLQPDLRHVKLNCKQCKIYKVCINNLWEVDYLYNDSSLEMCPPDTTQRDLAFFAKSQLKAISSVEADSADGELTINLPSEISTAIAELRPVKLLIEFVLEQPQTAIQFVVPEGRGSHADRSSHMFTYNNHNSSRLWFPCIDTYSELCTWKLEFTVDSEMVAVSCGDLVEVLYTPNMSQKVYHYYMPSPTAAPNIALAVGPFEIIVDPNMHEVTHFCLPGLLPLLKHTTSILHQVFELYEELMSSCYPYSCYKQVFVDQAYNDVSPYATMSIFSTKILHSQRIIDQTPESRTLMASAIAHQFFGCFIGPASWYDTWLIEGLTGFLTALYIKKFFGNNEYRFFIMKEMKEVCDYEKKLGGIVLNPRRSETSLHFSVTHPHVVSSQYMAVFSKKAHLVMRILQTHIGLEHLLQAVNKLLSLAYNASQQTFMFNTWFNMLLSHTRFLKVMSSVTSKDIKPLFRQWVTQCGYAQFNTSFVFIRKRNVVELEIKQDHNAKGAIKYAGPIMVVIQELDGSFKHTFNIEEDKTKFEITCHSKSRRNKKKKIPLVTGEEVDMDLSAMDPDSPVLWLRLDPDMVLLREVSIEQADYMWQYELKYERDVIAQSDAIVAVDAFPTSATRFALTDILENEQCFYKIRIQACKCLAKVANSMVTTWAGPPAMMTIFRKMFGSHSCPSIIRQNNFTNFQQYFLLKTIPVMMAKLRTAQNICPTEVFRFLLDLSKYNDNTKNKYSDNFYRACLIDAFATTVTPAVTMVAVSSGADIESLSSDTRLVLEEITRYLNMEKLIPSYRLVVTTSCLRAIRVMQRFGHLPSESSVFRSYAQAGVFQDVQIAALEVIIDFIKTEKKADELDWLLNYAIKQADLYIRHKVFVMLARNPPFTKSDRNHPLNTPQLVETLWYIMTTKLLHDHRARCDLIDLYYILYGNSQPSCIPPAEIYKPKKIIDEPLPAVTKPLSPVIDKSSEQTSSVDNLSAIQSSLIPVTSQSTINVTTSSDTVIHPASTSSTLVKSDPDSMPSTSVQSCISSDIGLSTLPQPSNSTPTVTPFDKPLLFVNRPDERSLKRKASDSLIIARPKLESLSHGDMSLQPVSCEEAGSFKLKIKIGSSDTSQENSPLSASTDLVVISSEIPSAAAQSSKGVAENKTSSMKSESLPIKRVSSWTEGTSHLSEEDSSSTVNSPANSPSQKANSPPTGTKDNFMTATDKPPIPKLSFEGLFPKGLSSTDVAQFHSIGRSRDRAGESGSSPRRSSKKKKKKEKHKHKHKHKHRHESHKRHGDRDYDG